ncbi:uncharacterized protein LOC121177701 [Toxotes jaculatrix]|uniref:uncharacterized protein LOC121177701 n=1 Tax=Toxotes jaculatrix TaxID=941984 RepID=UPI001B3AE4F1|nr:uncharacterized protein LOC121177701 [Toxotes jaculatrix]
MDLLWRILPVFLVCAEAQNVTEVHVKLGQNVTLTCSGKLQSTYWYVEVYGQLNGCIGRTYSENFEPSYYYNSPTFKTKYWLLRTELVVTDITAEDSRLYFCAKRTNDSIVYVDAFRLVLDLPTPPSTNDSEPKPQQEQQPWLMRCELLTYGSLTLNIFLTLTLTGWVCTSLCLKRKSRTLQVNQPSPDTYCVPEELETPQYEEISLSPSRAPPPAAPSECIYHKAQLPGNMLPQR